MNSLLKDITKETENEIKDTEKYLYSLKKFQKLIKNNKGNKVRVEKN